MSLALSELFSSPQIAPNITRTTVQNLTTFASFNHSNSYNLNIKWKLYGLDEVTYAQVKEIDMSIFPTSNSPSLILGSNTLFYGPYKVVTYITLEMSNQLFQEELITYQRIVPTGIKIYGFSNGRRDFTIGRLQTFEIKANEFSIDPDLITDARYLSYKFYCKIVNKNLGYVNYVASEPTRPDLFEAQSMNLAETQSCFTSKNDYVFDSTQNQLLIKAGALKPSSINNNLFVVRTENLNEVYFQTFRIDICGNYFNHSSLSKNTLYILITLTFVRNYLRGLFTCFIFFETF